MCVCWGGGVVTEKNTSSVLNQGGETRKTAEREREREVSQIENWRAVSFGESDNRK